jgi:hypothetical protein
MQAPPPHAWEPLATALRDPDAPAIVVRLKAGGVALVRWERRQIKGASGGLFGGGEPAQFVWGWCRRGAELPIPDSAIEWWTARVEEWF